MKVRCLAQEHDAVPWPVLEPGPLDLVSSALTIYGHDRKLLAVKKQNSEVDRHSLGAFLSN